jgi:hypothetical protein
LGATSVQYQEPLRPVVSRLLRPKSVPSPLADAFQVADAVGAEDEAEEFDDQVVEPGVLGMLPYVVV